MKKNMNKNEKILITDDSLMTRKSIIKLLKGTPYTIEQASNGKEALDKISKNNYNLMLLDLLMPDMTGIDVLKNLKDKGIELPVIVVSADIQTSTQEICIEYGAKEFLNKPPKKEELIEAIEKHLK
jgi:CheY-like chemotaxis protein